MPYADPEQRRANVRRYHRDPKNREVVEAAKRRWKEKNPDKRRAHQAINNAIRDGKAQREGCLFCDEKAQAHHHDYTKPLDVTWLCPRHHKIAHASETR